MRIPLLLSFIIILLKAQSQRTINVDKDGGNIPVSTYFLMGQGYPVSSTKYIRVIEGSPYFNDYWMKGKLAMGDDQFYDSLRLRLDLLENELQYVSKDGRELIATTPVRGVTLLDSVSGKQFHFVHSSFFTFSTNMDKGWYQLLVTGTATLYKRILKTISENKPYGSATAEHTIKTFDQYFIASKNNFTRVKKLKDLPDLLQDKKQELTHYVRELAGKNDEDFYNAVFYYNQLVGK